MLEYAVNFLGNCCELFVIHYFFRNFDKKYSKAVFVVFSGIFTFLQFLSTTLFLSKSYLIILGTVLFCFLVSLLYNIKWSNRLFYTIFLYLILALPEAIISMSFALVFKIDMSYMQNNVLVFAICTISSKFLSYIFVLVTQKKKFKLNNSQSKNMLWIYSLPIASILIMILFLRCCYQIEDFSFQIITLVSTIVLAFANIAIFFIIDKQNVLIETKEKLLFAEKHITNQLIHYQELYKYQNELRIFRHDIRNRLEVLIRLIKNSQLDKAMDIMQTNLDWLEESTNNIVNSGNPIIDAILQSKLHNAKEMGIVLNISTKLAGEIKIDEMELAIVLGNTLDNAIEAVEKLHNIKDKRINFSLMTTEDRISVFVTNPVESDIDIENLFTTKKNKEKHGYGIKSIKAVAERYDGMVLFSCENKVFSVNINIANFGN